MKNAFGLPLIHSHDPERQIITHARLRDRLWKFINKKFSKKKARRMWMWSDAGYTCMYMAKVPPPLPPFHFIPYHSMPLAVAYAVVAPL